MTFVATLRSAYGNQPQPGNDHCKSNEATVRRARRPRIDGSTT